MLVTLRSELDGDLHIIRSVVRHIKDPKARAEAETARWKLYSALESDDCELARTWLTALRVTMQLAQPNWSPDTDNALMGALYHIKQALEDKP